MDGPCVRPPFINLKKFSRMNHSFRFAALLCATVATTLVGCDDPKTPPRPVIR